MMPGASSLTKNISGPSHLDLSTIGRLPWGIARALFVVAALLSAVAFGLSRWALKLALVQRGSHELTRTPLFFAFAGLGHGQHLPSAGRGLAVTPCECRWRRRRNLNRRSVGTLNRCNAARPRCCRQDYTSRTRTAVLSLGRHIRRRRRRKHCR